MASIDKVPSGRWRARYRDPQGGSRSKTFDRKRDAERFLSARPTWSGDGEPTRNAAGSR